MNNERMREATAVENDRQTLIEQASDVIMTMTNEDILFLLALKSPKYRNKILSLLQ